MKYALFILALFFSCSVFGQKSIQFDSLVYDLGTVVQGGSYTQEVLFKNTGDKPVIITRANTSDGGTYASWQKDPIPPGKIGKIKFHYSTRGRFGYNNKTINVRFNNDENYHIRMKWIVRHPYTKVKIYGPYSRLGSIKYGQIDSITYVIKNVGQHPLHLPRFPTTQGALKEIFRTKTIFEGGRNIRTVGYRRESIAPGEKVYYTLFFTNPYGNIGVVERNLILRTNTKKTIKLDLKVNFIGGPCDSIMNIGAANKAPTLYFRNNMLYKRVSYDAYERTELFRKDRKYYESTAINGQLQNERFFRRKTLYKEKRYTDEKVTELDYENGKMIRKEEKPIEKQNTPSKILWKE